MYVHIFRERERESERERERGKERKRKKEREGGRTYHEKVKWQHSANKKPINSYNILFIKYFLRYYLLKLTCGRLR